MMMSSHNDSHKCCSDFEVTKHIYLIHWTYSKGHSYLSCNLFGVCICIWNWWWAHSSIACNHWIASQKKIVCAWSMAVNVCVVVFSSSLGEPNNPSQRIVHSYDRPWRDSERCLALAIRYIYKHGFQNVVYEMRPTYLLV